MFFFLWGEKSDKCTVAILFSLLFLVCNSNCIKPTLWILVNSHLYDTVYITVNTSNIQYGFFLQNLCPNKPNKTSAHPLMVLTLISQSSSTKCKIHGFWSTPYSSNYTSMFLVDCQRAMCHIRTSISEIQYALWYCVKNNLQINLNQNFFVLFVK